jgi:DNA-3-methyladenine glycosylase
VRGRPARTPRLALPRERGQRVSEAADPATPAGGLAVSPAALPPAFYDRSVLHVARDLIGCGFSFDGVGGRIVETEAYAHDDPCCHGFRGRTPRNAVMFGPPGYLYVYFTYGMHFCSNLVCEAEGRAAAVLLRALEPLQGLELMHERRGHTAPRLLCSGPARLTQALGIDRRQDGLPAWLPPLLVSPRPGTRADDPSSWGANAPQILVTTRVGVGDDRQPWRFVDADSSFLSRRLPPY